MTGLITLSVSAALVDPPKFPFAVKVAVSVSDATELGVVVSAAVPLVNVAVPSDVVPLKKVTVPFGTPEPEDTVAVKISPAPTATEPDARLSIVTVGIAVAVTVVAGLFEAPSLTSPAYCADRLWVPDPFTAVESVAVTVVPETAVSTGEEPIMVVPSRKFTIPVGAPASEVPTTVAVKSVLKPACSVEGEAVNVVVEGATVGITVTVTLPNGYAE
jgi:hypothetical protein